MLLTLGALLWLAFLVSLFDKVAHPQQKNLRGEDFLLAGLVMTFFTVITYLGFRHRAKP